MSVKIVVLDDGETWAGSALVMTVTDDAYDKLCNGEKIRHLDDGSVLNIEACAALEEQ